jgi:tetratricopeptide (TPR) repeat protein
VLYAGQGQFEKAKVALEKALRTHPSYSTAHENLGDIYAKMASQAYDRALQLDRSKTSTTTKLALIKDMYSPNAKTSGSKTQLASVSISPASTPPATPVVAAAPAPVATPSAPAASSAPAITAAVPAPPKAAAAKPAVAEAAHSGGNEEVLQALNDWAKAWSSRNVKKYLAMYAKDFKTPNNESRSKWEQQRRDRISKPQPIVVSVSNARVKFQDDNHASVSFVQSYRSGALKSTTLKTLEMTKSDGLWQILSEQAGAKR